MRQNASKQLYKKSYWTSDNDSHSSPQEVKKSAGFNFNALYLEKRTAQAWESEIVEYIEPIRSYEVTDELDS